MADELSKSLQMNVFGSILVSNNKKRLTKFKNWMK